MGAAHLRHVAPVEPVEYAKGCTGNVGLTAEQALMTASHGRRRTGKPWHRYKCVACEYWHVTSERPDIRPSAAAIEPGV